MSTSVLFDAPGPRARARYRVIALVGALATVGAIAWAVVQFGAKGNLDAAKWTPFVSSEIWVSYLIPGLAGTLKAAAISIALAGALGLALGLGRMSQTAPLRWVCTVVIEFFRAVPVLLMMIFAFNLYAFNAVFPADLNTLAAVVTGLTLYNGTIVAELLRSGVSSLPSGQREAGLSIGLTESQTLRSIQLPQALTAMLPAIVGQLVVVLKDSALGQIITYPELLNTFQQIGSYKSNPVPALMVIAVIFVAINYSLTTLAGRAERRLRSSGRPTLGGSPAAGAIGVGDDLPEP